MSNWNNAQSEYSDDEYYSDDSEYAPIEATAWGSQSIAADGTTNVNLTVQGWESLIDPNIKVKDGGIGSGQLHRQGRNFQPIDEQMIIDRRLGKPVASTSGKKKRGKKGPRPMGHPSSAPPGGKKKPFAAPLKPVSSSAYRAREAITTGPWASAELASTPFWESPANRTNSGTSASKYATPSAPSSAPVTPSRPPQQQSQWHQIEQQEQQQSQYRNQQQQQQQRPQQQQQQSQWSAPAPAQQSQWSAPAPAQQSQWAPPAQQHPPAPAVPPQSTGFGGTGASKYASTAQSKWATSEPTTPQQQYQQTQQPPQQPPQQPQQPPQQPQ
ncbi:hypothetical protein A0J61_01871, partial [Choanephora cucurbitarum]